MCSKPLTSAIAMAFLRLAELLWSNSGLLFCRPLHFFSQWSRLCAHTSKKVPGANASQRAHSHCSRFFLFPRLPVQELSSLLYRSHWSLVNHGQQEYPSYPMDSGRWASITRFSGLFDDTRHQKTTTFLEARDEKGADRYQGHGKKWGGIYPSTWDNMVTEALETLSHCRQLCVSVYGVDNLQKVMSLPDRPTTTKFRSAIAKKEKFGANS